MAVGGVVASVAFSEDHVVSKIPRSVIHLKEGLGVEGDAHAGATVQHLSRVARDPSQPNLRQVHLVHEELFDELAAAGFTVTPHEVGENITTRGLPLLQLPTGTLLRFGDSQDGAAVRVTGLRNPCKQLDGLQPGLMMACLGRDGNGRLIRKAGIMGVVEVGGPVAPNDAVNVVLPPEPHENLQPV